MIGVSGGGGEPLWARVVETEAVESNLCTPDWFGTRRAPAWAPLPLGGGQYCWW